MSAASAGARCRVGYLLRMYPRFSQTFIVNEILELEAQGVEVRIGSLRRPTEGIFHDLIARVRAPCDYLPDYFWENGGKIRAAHAERLAANPRGWLRALAQVFRHRSVKWFDFVQAGLVCRWAHKHKLEHLHVHFGTSEATVAWLARLMGGPSYSLTLHAFDIFRDNVDRRLLTDKINLSRFTVTVCEGNRRFLVESLPGLAAARLRVNYNGVDLQRFAVPREPRSAGSIFAVGRLIEKKGFSHLVRAVGLLRDRGTRVQCRIAGEGPEKHSLQSAIAALGLDEQVVLTGPLRQDAVREALGTAACLVLPCVRARDGNVDALPTVLLEAQASGCPVISTRISGVPEIIEDGASGLLVEPGDDAGLAAAIERVIAEPELAGRLAVGGRRRVEERFDIRKNVAVLRDWLTGAEPAATGARARATVAALTGGLAEARS